MYKDKYEKNYIVNVLFQTEIHFKQPNNLARDRILSLFPVVIILSTNLSSK